MRDDKVRLQYILDSISQIEKYLPLTEAEFSENELVRVWIIHHLQMIGEAVSRLTDTTKSSFPETPWASIAAMRNVIVHEYFGIDPSEIWVTAVKDIPELKIIIKTLSNNQLNSGK